MRWFLGIFIAACLVTDFLPHRGPPHFRYTGSDPDVEVWNIGWPLAMLIYDPSSGVHIGPLAEVVIPAQIVVLVIAGVALVMTRRAKQGERLNAD